MTVYNTYIYQYNLILIVGAPLRCCSVAFVKCLELYQKLLHVPFYLCHSLSLATICTLSLATICCDKMEWNKSTWCKVPLKTADKDEWETWKVIVSQSVAEVAGIAAAESDLSGLSGWKSFSNQREEQRTSLSSERLPLRIQSVRPPRSDSDAVLNHYY